MAALTKKSDQRITLLDGAKEYTQLRFDVTKAGILHRLYGYYTFMIIVVLVGLAGSMSAIWVTKNPWLLVLNSILLAFFTVQAGGLIHDAGHRAIFKSNFWNDLWGHLFGSVIAFGYREWREKHNAHHAHTNEVEEDPDLDVPFMSFTKERILAKTGIQRYFSRYQVYFYYFLGSLAGFFLRLANIDYMKKKYKPYMWWELLLYGISSIFWYVSPFLLFDIHKALIVFFVTHISTGFYMMHIFAPNHKGMPEIAKGVKLSFLEQQIMTSRNVDGHWLSDIFYMGLNYQIEHHLFPNCPRINLPKITPYVKAVCKKMKLEYTSVSIIETDIIILKELNEVAKVAFTI